MVSKKNDKEALVGLVTLGNILAKVARGRAALTDPVSKVMFKFNKSENYRVITTSTLLKDMTAFFDLHPAAVVAESNSSVPKHVVTKFDLVSFMVKRHK